MLNNLNVIFAFYDIFKVYRYIVIEIHCLVSEQDPRTYAEIEQRGNGNLEWRTVTICSGLDLVNVNYTPMIAADPDTARVGTRMCEVYKHTQYSERCKFLCVFSSFSQQVELLFKKALCSAIIHA